MKPSESQAGHRLTVYLPQPLYRRLKSEARARKLSVGKVVREHLASERAKPSVIDLMGGLVGSVRGGPADLSTNPKWMDGFGQDIRRVKPDRE